MARLLNEARANSVPPVQLCSNEKSCASVTRYLIVPIPIRLIDFATQHVVMIKTWPDDDCTLYNVVAVLVAEASVLINS